MNRTNHQATWIWYPDDYEIWLHQKVSVLRQFRGYICPPSWRLDAAYTSVKFRKTFDLAEPELLHLAVQGTFVLLMDNSMTPVPYEPNPITTVLIPAGRHELTINVFNDQTIPAIYASGANCGTDESWEVTALNGKWVNAASWQFHDIDNPPQHFPFAYETVDPVSITDIEGGVLVDFGRETFGYIRFLGVTGRGSIHIYYGESKEEAMAGVLAETFDEMAVDSLVPTDYCTAVTRAFRYVQIKSGDTISFSHIQHEYEYLPMDRRGAFRCSDDKLNAIWDLAAHTLQLNMREFLYDGMKRDRWVWAGDSNLGLMINNYVFFEQDVARRTFIALRGKEPVDIHINTIMDFTFYWFISLNDYYLYTGDLTFIKKRYSKMLSLMEFCLNRRNEAGMMVGYPEDWVFIDWAPMDLRGEVCAEQILFCRCLESMTLFAKELGDQSNDDKFSKLAGELRDRIFELFWDDKEGALVHSRFEGELNRQVLKYPNMFATRFGFLDERQKQSVKHRVMLNDEVQKIKTPFMRFFELEALCQMGEQQYVLNEIRSYWGGMIDLGATSFWEEFDPSVPEEEQYDMYGDKYRKSLAHAWGAAPNFLLGKYILGVQPIEPGYSKYLIEPHLCDLDWFEGAVPTANGNIEIFMDKSHIRVKTIVSGEGILRFTSLIQPKASAGKLTVVGENRYELRLTIPEFEYEIEIGH